MIWVMTTRDCDNKIGVGTLVMYGVVANFSMRLMTVGV